MRHLVQANYRTYLNLRTQSPEGHAIRLACFVAVSVFFSVFFEIAANSGMIVTALTVLTGFIFTALCSDHALADAALPRPKNESEINRISRLGALSENFQARSAYFIAVAICTLCLLLFLSTATGPTSDRLISKEIIIQLMASIPIGHLPLILQMIYTLFSSLALFLFLECVYTFYRLSETTLAIVDARRDYLRLGDDEP